MTETQKKRITIETLAEHLEPMGVVRDKSKDGELKTPKIGLMLAWNYEHPRYGADVPRLARSTIVVASQMRLDGQGSMNLPDNDRTNIDRRPRLALSSALISPRDDPFAVLFAHAMYLWPVLQPCELRLRLAPEFSGLIFRWAWRPLDPGHSDFVTTTAVNPHAIVEHADAGKMNELAQVFVEGTIRSVINDLVKYYGVPPGDLKTSCCEPEECAYPEGES